MDDRTTHLTQTERRSIVIGVLVAMMLATLDQAIIAPAMPVIGMTLGHTEYLPWIVASYMLTATAVTPLYGKLADTRGRRPMIFAAIAIFLLGSVLCAAAPNMFWLIGARAIQGIGGGGLIALAQTIIADVVAPRERGKYVGYISTVWAASSVGGPVLGGFFAEHLHWSLIFWINVPIALAAFLVTARVLRRLPDVRRERSLDLVGAILMVAATSAIMLALTWGGTLFAWLSAPIFGLGLLTLLLIAAFFWHSASSPEPLLPVGVLRNRIVAYGAVSNFFCVAGHVGLSIYLPIYLILIEGMGPAKAGLALMALLVGGVIGANTAGRFMARIVHYKRMATFGVLTGALVMAILALGSGRIPFVVLEGLLLVAGIGMGTQYPVTIVSVQNSVDRSQLGTATGALGFLRSLGSALGVAVLGAILISNGVAQDLRLLEQMGTAIDRSLVASTFSLVFGVAAIFVLVGWGFLQAMEERPLSGQAPADKA